MNRKKDNNNNSREKLGCKEMQQLLIPNLFLNLYEGAGGRRMNVYATFLCTSSVFE